MRPANRLAAVCLGNVLLVAGLLFMTASTAGTKDQPVKIVSAGQDVSIPSEATVVDIEKFSYSPASVTVPENGTVVWANREPFDHDVTFKPSNQLAEELISPKVGKGGKIVVRFKAPGEYRYYCHLHPFMEGIVKVDTR